MIYNCSESEVKSLKLKEYDVVITSEYRATGTYLYLNGELNSMCQGAGYLYFPIEYNKDTDFAIQKWMFISEDHIIVYYDVRGDDFAVRHLLDKPLPKDYIVEICIEHGKIDPSINVKYPDGTSQYFENPTYDTVMVFNKSAKKTEYIVHISFHNKYVPEINRKYSKYTRKNKIKLPLGWIRHRHGCSGGGSSGSFHSLRFFGPEISKDKMYTNILDYYKDYINYVKVTGDSG